MSTAEAADALEMSDENVKVRLDRGHSVLRRELAHRVGKSSRNVFALYGCALRPRRANVFRSLGFSTTRSCHEGCKISPS